MRERSQRKLRNVHEFFRTIPLLGQREELLKDLSVEFRYLVEGNYKILYYTLPEKIVISLVFDCRQNPERMRDIK